MDDAAPTDWPEPLELAAAVRRGRGVERPPEAPADWLGRVGDVDLRLFREEDRDAVLDLYVRTFPVKPGGRWTLDVDADLAPSRAVVAVAGDEIAGFGRLLLNEDAHGLWLVSSWALAAARYPAFVTKGGARLREALLSRVEEPGEGPEVTAAWVALVPCDNELTRGLDRLRRRDASLDALAVAPGHRRKGLGRELVRLRMELARLQGASVVEAHCWGGGPSLELYRGLGFSPVMRVRPGYTDGHEKVLVAARLESGPAVPPGEASRYDTDAGLVARGARRQREAVALLIALGLAGLGAAGLGALAALALAPPAFALAALLRHRSRSWQVAAGTSYRLEPGRLVCVRPGGGESSLSLDGPVAAKLIEPGWLWVECGGRGLVVGALEDWIPFLADLGARADGETEPGRAGLADLLFGLRG